MGIVIELGKRAHDAIPGFVEGTTKAFNSFLDRRLTCLASNLYDVLGDRIAG